MVVVTHFSMVTARGKSREGFSISARTVGKAWFPAKAKAMLRNAEVASIKVGLPMALRLRGALTSRGPWTPSVIMTRRTVMMMLAVQSHDAQETKRIERGTQSAHIATAETTVNATVQVACSETVLRPMVRVTRADAEIRAMLIRNPTAKMTSTQGPPSTRP